MNKIFSIIVISSALSACTLGPDYQAPQHNFMDGWFSLTSENISQETVNTQWWQTFNDPLLTKYISQSSENNKDVQVALANIKRARAVLRESGASLMPAIDVNGGAERSKSSEAASSQNSGEIRNVFDAGFDASWELDLFGSNRRGTEAAQARIGSAEASYADIMLSTFAEVARQYYTARGTQKRIEIMQKNADLLGQTYETIKVRADAGEGSEFDVTRARGEWESVQSRLPNLQAELMASLYSLSFLLGQPPEALLNEMQTVKPLPAPPDIVPVGLRSEILRRRPDIRMAERDLAASSAEIGVAVADFFPKFSLTGDIGSQARTFGDIFTAAAGLWSLGAVMQWSVFDGGANLARVDIAKAENDAALATYEKAVLAALRDSETALTRYGREIETRNRLEQSVASRRESVRLAQQLFDAGEVDYLAVLDAQRELTASEDDLVISETNTLTKLISLYTALGGGWER